jgi:hypothetical protein
MLGLRFMRHGWLLLLLTFQVLMTVLRVFELGLLLFRETADLSPHVAPCELGFESFDRSEMSWGEVSRRRLKIQLPRD